MQNREDGAEETKSVDHYLSEYMLRLVAGNFTPGHNDVFRGMSSLTT